MTNLGPMTNKHQELVAIGAAIAAGCRPCTAYHFKAATAAGATRDEIRRAVEIALEARRSAASWMSQLADRLLSATPASGPATEPETAYLDPLIAAGAALAINCGPDFTGHVSLARDAGASDSEVHSALQIARAVKRMAGKRVEAAAARILPDTGGVMGDGVRPTQADKTIHRAPECASAVGDLRDGCHRGSDAAGLQWKPIDEGPGMGLL